MLVQIGEKEQGCSMILGIKEQYPKANQSVIQRSLAAKNLKTKDEFGGNK